MVKHGKPMNDTQHDSLMALHFDEQGGFRPLDYSLDAFTMLGMPMQLHLDSDALEANYYALSTPINTSDFP